MFSIFINFCNDDLHRSKKVGEEAELVIVLMEIVEVTGSESEMEL
jgi:hypothetical protein